MQLRPTQSQSCPNREGMLSMFAGALTSTLSGLAVAMQAYADKQEEPAA